jgi:hypothetical protein
MLRKKDYVGSRVIVEYDDARPPPFTNRQRQERSRTGRAET